MQKKLIALAVAGLMSGAAFAQSNVTIYGVMDMGYLNYSNGNATAGAVKSKAGIDSGILATSRIGFRGTEDLGNGLRATFTIETALAADEPQSNTNAARLGDRVSTLGLTGNFGTVVMGRMASLTAGHHGRYNVLYGTAIAPTRNAARGAAFDGEFLDSTRVANTLAYVSPNFNGFSGAIAYVFDGTNGARGAFTQGNVNNGNANQIQRARCGGEVKTVNDVTANGSEIANCDMNHSKAWNLSADYANGPLGVGLAYFNKTNNTGTNNTALRQWNLGGSYDFGVVAVRAGWANQTSNAANVGKARLWSIGAVIPVSGTGNVHIGWADSKRTDTGDVQRGAKAWSLAYTHGMSKRTTAYVGYGYADNRRNATGNFFGIATDADKSARAWSAGLSHSF